MPERPLSLLVESTPAKPKKLAPPDHSPAYKTHCRIGPEDVRNFLRLEGWTEVDVHDIIFYFYFPILEEILPDEIHFVLKLETVSDKIVIICGLQRYAHEMKQIEQQAWAADARLAATICLPPDSIRVERIF